MGHSTQRQQPSSRGHAFFSLGLMPALMGLGHLCPTIGAIHAATGSYQFPSHLLVLIGTAAALVDSYDTYKDIPYSKKPSNWIWRPWIYSLWAIVLINTYYSGLQTAIQMYRFSLIGLFWGTPCVPSFSQLRGFHLFKPKTVFCEAKSLVVAVCMAYVTADTSIFYFCHTKDSQCTDHSIRARSLCLAILYQFFRETACDVRDIPEDTRDGMKTLPVKLGKNNTLLFMGVLGLVMDSFLVQAVSITWSGLHVNPRLLAGTVVRIGVLIAVYYKILQYPRENSWAWGVMSLLGLSPVVWAQATLLESS